MPADPQTAATTAQQVMAEVIAGYLSRADSAYGEHEKAAREIEIALSMAGFYIVRSKEHG